MAVERITYQAGGNSFIGALVYDERTSGKRPLMLMAPNWLGVTDDAILYADDFDYAEEGTIKGYDREADMTLTPENYYADFVQGMREIGYEGYIGYELCHPLPKVDGEPVGIGFADNQARLAAEYMRGVLQRNVGNSALSSSAVAGLPY